MIEIVPAPDYELADYQTKAFFTVGATRPLVTHVGFSVGSGEIEELVVSFSEDMQALKGKVMLEAGGQPLTPTEEWYPEPPWSMDYLFSNVSANQRFRVTVSEQAKSAKGLLLDTGLGRGPFVLEGPLSEIGDWKMPLPGP